MALILRTGLNGVGRPLHHSEIDDNFIYLDTKPVVNSINGQVGDVVIEVNPTIPQATSSVLGGIKVGSGLSIDTHGVLSSNYTLPTATVTNLGGVKVDGTTITITNGTISTVSSGTNYTLPTASASVLGGVKIGTGLTIDGNGVLSSTAAIDTTRVSKAGDTMTGPLVLSGNPTTNLQAATKQYVDGTGSSHVVDRGYHKFPGGFTIQWTTVTANTNSGNNTTYPFTWPIPFTTILTANLSDTVGEIQIGPSTEGAALQHITASGGTINQQWNQYNGNALFLDYEKKFIVWGMGIIT
jgi:hypothetical protein